MPGAQRGTFKADKYRYVDRGGRLKEMLTRMNVEGGVLQAVETKDGCLLTLYDKEIRH